VESRLIYKKLDLEAHQKLYFSRIRYQGLRGVFPEDTLYDVQLDDLTEKDSVLLVVGVANPRPLIKYCGKFDFKLKILHFPDHHNFTTKDLKLIADRYNSMTGARKIILTTEKDAGRLLHNPYYPTKLKPFTFCVPIQVSDMQSWPDGEHSFDDHLRVAIEKINRKNDKNRN
jgi:tetraacyldisaccharide 4'-kinase